MYNFLPPPATLLTMHPIWMSYPAGGGPTGRMLHVASSGWAQPGPMGNINTELMYLKVSNYEKHKLLAIQHRKVVDTVVLFILKISQSILLC